jgi:homoserine O-acetyltransferase/O-succinyltransferase
VRCAALLPRPPNKGAEDEPKNAEKCDGATALGIVASTVSTMAVAADYPTPKEADWVARDFRFHTGQVLAELRLHYTTIGAPSGEPVLLLHGTAGSAASLLNANFAGELQ